MSLPVTLATWGGAASPIALLIVLLVCLRRSVVEAAALGALSAIAVAVLAFRSTIPLLSGEIAKGIWSSVSIIIVIFPAILLFEASVQAGGFETVRKSLTRMVPDKLLQVLTLGWCFSSFLQGPSGFGVPVAVVAPLLISIGVKPLWAVVIPLLGHAWGNTFGTLALAWDAMLQQSGPDLNIAATALWAGLFLWILNLTTGFLLCWIYNGRDGVIKGLPAVLVISLLQGGGELALVGPMPTLAVVAPSIAALAACPLLAKLPRYASASSGPDKIFTKTPPAWKNVDTPPLSLNLALLPYTILTVAMLAALLTPSVASFLGGWKSGFAFPETVSGFGLVNHASALYSPITWLTHSGFFLLFAVLAASLVYTAKGALTLESWKTMGRQTLAKSVPSAISVCFLLVMSKVMSGSGQVDVLAQGTAQVAGKGYALLTSAVGLLGSFISSSNVSSNILFTQFQESMARFTGYDSSLILAAQTAGAAVGTMISPSKVLLATTTAGIVGEEGAVIRALLGLVIGISLLMGLVIVIWG